MGHERAPLISSGRKGGCSRRRLASATAVVLAFVAFASFAGGGGSRHHNVVAASRASVLAEGVSAKVISELSDEMRLPPGLTLPPAAQVRKTPSWPRSWAKSSLL